MRSWIWAFGLVWALQTMGAAMTVAQPMVQGSMAKEEAVSVSGLAGAFIKPAGATSAVLILPGSGGTDRDGNGAGGLKTDAYKQLAEGLAKAGIASLRYDKRGIGESKNGIDGKPAAEKDLTIETSAADAAALLKWLRGQAGIAQASLVGHSEGGLVALLAAKQEKADRIVLLTATGRPLGVVLRKQFERQPMPDDIHAEIERVLAALEAGKDPGAIKPPLDQIFRPSVQPFLRSVLALDPVPLVKDQTAPILVIGGGADLQIGRFDFDPLVAAKPGTKSHWEAKLTHVLKEYQVEDSGQVKVYSDPTVPVMPVVIEHVAAFVK